MLHVKKISFSYQDSFILKDISFKINTGEHVSVIGESGSGKSTLLKLLYGEFDLNEGHIFWKKNEILGPEYNLVTGPEFMKYVAQEFDLMPYTSVEENVGKYLSNFYPKKKKERTTELLEVVELSAFSKTKVKLLSGGQKQRVALARAIAKQPEIILLDEPFSHIDNFKKQSLRRNLFQYLKEKNISCVVATHDKDDVLGYADKMIVLNDSKIIAENTPQQLFKHPKNELIASFFGEFNQIKGYGIVYAHQLKVTTDSDLKVIVKQSYFKGDCYLIEGVSDNNAIFFQHSKVLKKGEDIYLKIKK